jgi:hypothetical protein
MGRNAPELKLVDSVLPCVGLALLLVGASSLPQLLPLAWLAIGLAFVGWVAEADGLSVPRPGRLPIRAYGCWETPLAFSVRHRGSDLLFSRDEDEHGAWSSQYTVRERPRVKGGDARFELPVRETGGWSLRGTTPVAALQFEHHERVSYVTRSSLEQALRAT